MIKLNKNGFTLVELIVSVALISVLLLFMYSLLANITFENDDDFIATKNQSLRIDIIKTIENNILNNPDITSFKVCNSNKMDFYYRNGATIRLKISDATISLETKGSTSSSWTTVNKWVMRGATLGQLTCEGNYNVHTCTIPVYTTNSNNKKYTYNSNDIDNNNTLDDITFTFTDLDEG